MIYFKKYTTNYSLNLCLTNSWCIIKAGIKHPTPGYVLNNRMNGNAANDIGLKTEVLKLGGKYV